MQQDGRILRRAQVPQNSECIQRHPQEAQGWLQENLYWRLEVQSYYGTRQRLLLEGPWQQPMPWRNARQLLQDAEAFLSLPDRNLMGHAKDGETCTSACKSRCKKC